MIELDEKAISVSLNPAALKRLTMTNPPHAFQRQGWGRVSDPVPVVSHQRPAHQPRVVMTLHDEEYIAIEILARHVPGHFRAIAVPSDAKTLTLADRVVHETGVTAQDMAVLILDLAGPGRQIAGQELPEWPLADEAYPGAVFLVVIGKSMFVGDPPDFCLQKMAYGKQRLAQTVCADRVKEVRLVFQRIPGGEQAAVTR
jgi:hypothetical protein